MDKEDLEKVLTILANMADEPTTEAKLVDRVLKIVLTNEDIEQIKSGRRIEFHNGKVVLSYQELVEVGREG